MWKILEIKADGDLITAARYFCAESMGDNTVETEGWWHFAEPKLTIPFAEVSEELVVGWVTDAIGKQVKARLSEQLATLESQKSVVAPWLPQVFTPSI
jgi:hypothetical protein